LTGTSEVDEKSGDETIEEDVLKDVYHFGLGESILAVMLYNSGRSSDYV
jgi:hypothetical protein